MDATREEVISPEFPSLGTLEVVSNLERKIANRTAGRIRGLRVEAVGDSVILCGRTSTYYVKQLATQIALDENSDLPLQNAIEVI